MRVEERAQWLIITVDIPFMSDPKLLYFMLNLRNFMMDKITQAIVLATFPKGVFEEKKFNSKKVKELEDEFLAVRGLKSTTLFDPKVEVQGDELVLVGLTISEFDQAENVKKSYRKTEEFSQKLATVVSEGCCPDSSVQIFLPENLKKDPDRPPRSVPEILEDGSFHYRTDSELEQAMAQEKALKKQDLVIGSESFKSFGKDSKKLFVNNASFKNEKLRFIYANHSNDYEIFAFPVATDGTVSEKPIKLSFDELLIKEKKHLQFVKHAPFVDKNPIVVVADFTKKFDLSKNKKLFNTIKVLEIVDFGFDGYSDKSPKIWEES